MSFSLFSQNATNFAFWFIPGILPLTTKKGDNVCMKQPKQNKARTPARQALTCPDHPGRTFKSHTALASHQRHHQTIETISGGEVKVVEVPGKQTITAADPKTHLQTALDQLTTRKAQIDHELNRIEALQTESRDVTTRIEALTTALKAFQPQGMAASG